MSLAHKLSMELRAAEDRTHEMEAEVEHWRERAARAEQWLRTIQTEIEEKLLVSHLMETRKRPSRPLLLALFSELTGFAGGSMEPAFWQLAAAKSWSG